MESKKHDEMQKVVHALTRKVLSLENEMKKMKNTKENESFFNHDDIKHSSSKLFNVETHTNLI